MTYQASVAYPAPAGGQWPAGYDSAYQPYYAAYGYNGYDMSAYYQQPVPSYAPAVAPSGAQTDVKAPERADATAAAPPPPPGEDLNKTATTDQGAEKAAPPPPPPPPPPPESSEVGKIEQNSSSIPSTAAAAPEASTASVPSYDSAAYAQWYAQNYGPYYGYPGYSGYDQQAYAYWQQQQQQQQQQYADAYGYAAQANAYQQQPQPLPGHQSGPPDIKTSTPYGKPGQRGILPSACAQSDSYNAQPPPSNLYAPNSSLKNQLDRSRMGATGTNTVPIGPRALPTGVTGGGEGQPQQSQTSSFVIRPQVPTARRPNASAAPAYIAVGSSSTPSATGRSAPSAASSAASNGKDAAVAAAVAAGVASAAAAAAAAKASQSTSTSNQWPPSFTAWVTRCFNAARVRNIPDTRLSEKLMAYLDQVKAEGKLWTTDWDTLPLMLPDGSSEPQGGTSTPGSQVLSVSTGHGSQKRNRWGAVPESHASGYAAEQHGDQYPSSAGRQLHSSHRKRSHTYTESDDDERHSGETDQGGKAYNVKSHAVGNRKRKKSLEHDVLHHQQRTGRRGARGPAGPSMEEQRRRARAGRFGDGRAAGAAPGSPGGDSSGMDMSDDEDLGPSRFGGVVVGTCQALEKSYFRLTSQPDPATVRPEAVLERALERLVALIARGEATYFYSLDQFKGMRQDCTVQHLRNSLAVRVYEAHARSSLEYGDVAEFNQCQARLGHLYGEGQPGCMAEFTAYRLLYETAHCATAGHRGGGMAKALLHTMRNIPKELAGTPEIRHALQVREAVMTYNYAAFFGLYAAAPYLGRALMDSVAEHMRWAGLNAFVKACDLPVPVPDVALLLGFSPRPESATQGSTAAGAGGEEWLLPGCMHARLEGEAAPAEDAEQGAADCAAWLRDHGAVVVEKGSEVLLDTKASRGKLFVPEVTAKVAHGDENLSVNDFLSAAQRTLGA